ncbi:MAG: 50S ribosomal protein L3 [Candidatus Aenigmarchaeota archaeon]|nr:50S ribosomal protein L3P [uncultured archaeon]MBS3053219.1 50S ribosomal protein L3 [Candidatus Aenigmarchaeota archaeon]
MPKRTRPRHGSLQFWPRKRAKRIYPRVSHWQPSNDAKPLGFAGWKAGMTHVQHIDNNPKSPAYGKIIFSPVTILDAPALFVAAVRYYKKTPSGLSTAGEKWAKVPKEIDIKRKIGAANPGSKDCDTSGVDDVRLVVCTQPLKSGMRKFKPEIFEIAVGGDLNKKLEYASSMLGKEIKAVDVFRIGEYIDASAVTQGSGFTGPVKRFGIRIQFRKDKQMHRHVGSIGSTVPRKVDWRVPAAGQYGFFTRTEFSKRVLMIGDDSKKITPAGGFVGYGDLKTFLLIEGSVPGPRKRLVRIRKSVRTQKVVPADIRYVSVESKQGK